MSHSISTRVSLALAAAAITTISASAGASDGPTRRPPTPAPPPESVVVEVDFVQPGARQGLLREGSHLMQAQGSFTHDPERNAWQFDVMPTSEQGSAYVLTAAPNSFLSEAQQVIEASPEHALVFEVTGEVLVYKGRNYLLLTRPPRVVAHSGPSTVDVPEADEPQPQTDQPAPRRDAESIMRELERQSGPVQRRPGTRREGGDVAQSRHSANPNLKREGSTLVMRRGRINRDAAGAWLFVFEADANGMSDPPMQLLPCLLLERLERHHQLRGNAPLLLSGRVFVYEDRNYLLPSVFQLPRERDIVMP